MKSKSILLLLLGTSLFFISCKKTEEAPASTEPKTETMATEKPAANDVSNITTTPAPCRHTNSYTGRSTTQIKSTTRATLSPL
ncbi:hypothetical protein H9X57_11670 [Flavobacterium piscinae]|uniref:hypothetical protein n=1 Tax=Flavobacterium piscinae TaxID=2506424 RepID=UPI0019945FA4|nr:hypothetical protein [Flavobacterium piscinae]MBC8883770.1 hypothetical protein [Flavobacterium piscinae]